MTITVVTVVFLASLVYYVVYDVWAARTEHETITHAVKASFKARPWLWSTSLVIALLLIVHLYFDWP